MMKKQSFTVKFERPKTRAHKVLFDNNSPFKSKVVEDKTAYKRKPKFKYRDWQEA
jgi:hypothetical protein